MKRIILFFALVATFSATALAQNNAAAPVDAVEETTEVQQDGPQMSFEAMEIDYGKIEQDSDPYRVFKFTNTGTEPLLITNARGSCGCTVPSYSKAPVAPGATSEIKVRYDTHRLGQFRKRVTLTTNVGDEPIILTIKGLVEAKPAKPEAVPAGEQGMFNNGGGK
ncbi:DUF1573 domain-containing protein [Lewinella sp. W8]|uniref:DUF1573 domain-containing protein n=1 Tax=Lewinella sp. W8 TaxID=2528208 RepID=UPI0010685FB6|nr:DUF1573 domain-containing protein [Lewinella sp. W8]MTB51769.1 DUF1573 domain-containing protein [Lewinella sp. W8]